MLTPRFDSKDKDIEFLVIMLIACQWEKTGDVDYVFTTPGNKKILVHLGYFSWEEGFDRRVTICCEGEVLWYGEVMGDGLSGALYAYHPTDLLYRLAGGTLNGSELEKWQKISHQYWSAVKKLV